MQNSQMSGKGMELLIAKVTTAISQNQFDTLVILAFNLKTAVDRSKL